MTDKKIKLKIGRRVYNIGTDDILMDNGVSVQLITQNGPFRDWTYTVPVLSKSFLRTSKLAVLYSRIKNLPKNIAI